MPSPETDALPPPPLDAPPAADEAWVWAVPCSDPPAPVDVVATTLTEAEAARVARYRFEADRVRAVLGRGLLRVIVGGCAGIRPESVRLSDGPHGKPALADPREVPLEFNVSHSGDWVLIGLAAGTRIGVDVERIRPLSDLHRLTERFFAPAEARAVLELPPELQPTAFFDCWTRKESFIKAIGTGMQTALDRFEVEARPGRPPALISIDGSAEAAERWRIWSRAPDDGHRAAVAVGGPLWIHPYRWTGAGIERWDG
jgi:4'-phosphopantetheinyl transferase